MEVILLENIINLGNIGDKVKVKAGYGRNFLLKKGSASSRSNVRIFSRNCSRHLSVAASSEPQGTN